MARITEPDLILPSLYVIERNQEIKTSELIHELRSIFNPTGEDAEILSGRNDDKFSQIVRNLVSHHTLDQRWKFTTIDTSDGLDAKHTITSKGREHLQKNIALLDSIIFTDFDYNKKLEGIGIITLSVERGEKIIPYEENIVISEGRSKTVSIKHYERSRKLRDIAIDYYSDDGNIQCHVCGFDFYNTYGELGKGYIEIHHNKPIFQYENTDFDKFFKEAIENLTPLCSNCHRMIHRKREKHLSAEDLRITMSENQEVHID